MTEILMSYILYLAKEKKNLVPKGERSTKSHQHDDLSPFFVTHSPTYHMRSSFSGPQYRHQLQDRYERRRCCISANVVLPA